MRSILWVAESINTLCSVEQTQAGYDFDFAKIYY
jgi:hypothetical protein